MTTRWEQISDEAYKQWLLKAMEVDEFNGLTPVEKRTLLTQFEQQQQQQQQQNGKLRCYSMLYLCSEATIVFVLAVPVRVS